MSGFWHEEDHHRDDMGRFTESSMGAWAAKIAQRMADFRNSARNDAERIGLAFYKGFRPPGFEAAKKRHKELDQAYVDRKLTDQELLELKTLDDAFDELVKLIGHKNSLRFDAYGETRPHDIEPAASRMGYRRVGNHPEGVGGPEGPDDNYLSRSSHPLAGGLWIDPDRPGTRHAPAYRNDAGHIVSDLRAEPHRTATHKRNRQSRRREDWTHTPDDMERLHESEGGKIGYREEVTSEFLAWVKRAKARTRAEAPPQTWILQVNDRFEQRRDRRRG